MIKRKQDKGKASDSDVTAAQGQPAADAPQPPPAVDVRDEPTGAEADQDVDLWGRPIVTQTEEPVPEVRDAPVIDLPAPDEAEASAPPQGPPAVERAADLYRSMVETGGADDPVEALSRWVEAVQGRLRELPGMLQDQAESLSARAEQAASALESRLTGLEERLRGFGAALDRRLEELEGRIAEMRRGTEERSGSVDSRVTQLEQGRGDLALSLKEGMAGMGQQVQARMADLDRRLRGSASSVDARIEALEVRVQQVFGLFGQVARAVDPREGSSPGQSAAQEAAKSRPTASQGPRPARGSEDPPASARGPAPASQGERGDRPNGTFSA